MESHFTNALFCHEKNIKNSFISYLHNGIQSLLRMCLKLALPKISYYIKNQEWIVIIYSVITQYLK